MLKKVEMPKNGVGAPQDLDLLTQPLFLAVSQGESLEPAVLSIMESLGFAHFAFAISTASVPKRESRSYVWTTLSKQWMAEYDQCSYMEVDPRITRTLGKTTPFIWDAATIQADSKVRAFLNHAARYGTRSGVSLNLGDPRHARAGAFFDSPVSPVPRQRHAAIMNRLGDLMFFASRFHDLFVSNFVERGVPPGQRGAPLSIRERQCLQLAAQGMTGSVIGVKLGISERTTAFHFSSILSKLDASNRLEAIAKAVAMGIVHVNC